MSKTKKFMTTLVAVAALVCIVAFAACNANDDPAAFKKSIESSDLFDNTLDKSLPQTIIHDIVMDHFDLEKNPLPEGKTVKKAIFLGYDGYRADGLFNIQDRAINESSILSVKNEGGLYLTYSGGEIGAEQPTSTAPSWASMLTGGWKDYTGVDNNGYIKKLEAKTFLTKLAERGIPASFTTSWREHQSGTYFEDIVYTIQNALPVTYTHCLDDAATLYTVLSQVANPKGSAVGQPDAIFFTFEHGDHAGHATTYGNHNPEYVKGTQDADSWGMKILNTIYNRADYAEEDWLIIISTDHGGVNYGHGNQSIMERTTWLACNKTSYIQSRLNAVGA